MKRKKAQNTEYFEHNTEEKQIGVLILPTSSLTVELQ